MHLGDRNRHVYHQCQSDKPRQQSQDQKDSPAKLRGNRQIGRPPGKSKAGNKPDVVMLTPKYFRITVADHDDAQHQPQHQQCQGLQTIQVTQAVLLDEKKQLTSEEGIVEFLIVEMESWIPLNK